MSIEWTKDLNTGIDVIDEQHQRIVDYINQLNKAIIRQNDHLVGGVLIELADYCVSHFAFEESLMLKAGYPYLKPHKATHDMFVKRLKKFQDRYDQGEDVAAKLHDMLSTWLILHIKQTDMAYATEARESLLRIVQNKANGGWLSRAMSRFFE
ncbi:MAG: bacteriohemerythrin [Candidatus Thiodiazotropha sp. (ex Epidulcina cf. delphinae)]|nr:bacteriohemerythrin [Candidatus Thiodiazotropha sp. (ex Epidulcina cf. delphinae)]